MYKREKYIERIIEKIIEIMKERKKRIDKEKDIDYLQISKV